MPATKVRVAGGGYGLALLHDTENKTRTYINISRFDLGADVGAAKFRVLVIFENRELMETFRGGAWHSALGTDSAVGSTSYSKVGVKGDGYAVFYASDTGASLTLRSRDFQVMEILDQLELLAFFRPFPRAKRHKIYLITSQESMSQ